MSSGVANLGPLVGGGLCADGGLCIDGGCWVNGGLWLVAQATAMHYFKRFFLRHSVMEFDPKSIMYGTQTDPRTTLLNQCIRYGKE